VLDFDSMERWDFSASSAPSLVQFVPFVRRERIG
jgi:hypothetical protein